MATTNSINFDKCNIQRISNRAGVNITDCSPEYKIGARVLHWSDETRCWVEIVTSGH